MFHDVGKSQQHDYWRMYLVALYNSELNEWGPWSRLNTSNVAWEAVAALHAL
jgi:hypothetical protein